MVRTTPTRHRAGAALLISLALLAACGSDDDEAADTTAAATSSVAAAAPTTTAAAATATTGATATTEAAMTTESAAETTAASTAPAEMQTVRFANFGHLPSTTPFEVALAEGYFESNGIELEEGAPIYNAGEAIQTLFSGDADMAFLGITAAISGVQAGRDVKVVAVVSGGFPLELSLNNDVLADLAADGITPESPIADKVAALKGLTIASPAAGSTTDLVFRYTLDKYGLDADSDLTIQPLPDVASITAAARQGAADAIIGTIGGPTSSSVSEGFATIFIDFATQDEELAGLPYHVIVTSGEYLEANPEAVTGVVKAFYQAREDIEAGLSDEDLAAIKESVAPDMDEGIFAATPTGMFPRFTSRMDVSEAQYETSVAVVNVGADTPVSVTFDQVIDNSFVDAVTGD